MLSQLPKVIRKVDRGKGSRAPGSQAGNGSVVDATIFPAVPTHSPSIQRSSKRRVWNPLTIWRKRKRQSSQNTGPSIVTNYSSLFSNPVLSVANSYADKLNHSEPHEQASGSVIELEASILSLDEPSLISTSNGKPSGTSQPTITVDTSVRSSVTKESTSHCVEYSVESDQITTFKRCSTKTLFIGHPDQVNIPRDVLARWESDIRDQLRIDLGDVLWEIRRRGAMRKARESECNVTYELRMSGYAAKGLGTVILTPYIWVLCGSQWACSAVRKAVKDYNWISSFAPVEVHVGGAYLASMAANLDIQGLDYSHGVLAGDGWILYINIQEFEESFSLCGLVCCSTLKRGDYVEHHISRIGGLISLSMENGTVSSFGISTAHGVLDDILTNESSSGDAMEDDNSISSVVDTNDAGRSEDEEKDSDDDNVQPNPNDRNVPYERMGHLAPETITKWRNQSYGMSLSFLGRSFAASRPTNSVGGYAEFVVADNGVSVTTTTDHMLTAATPFCEHPRSLNNYIGQDGMSIDVVRHLTDGELLEGPVRLLYGQEKDAAGHLVAGSTNLVVRGETLTLRKLRTSGILANGVSGSWVVRGDALCGMIVAVFESEPYALMVTAQRLFDNVKEDNLAIRAVNVDAIMLREARILEEVRDEETDSASIFALRDVDSIQSCRSRSSVSSTELSIIFDFDSEILRSDIYERCDRGSVRRSLQRQQRNDSMSSTECSMPLHPAQLPATEGSSKDFIKIQKHLDLAVLPKHEACGKGISGPQDLEMIYKKPRVSVRRTCHDCGTMFKTSKEKQCGQCGHRRCTDCPRDPPKPQKYPFGYPGDEFGPKSIPHYECHVCQAVISPNSTPEVVCRVCGHEKCDECPRLKPRRVYEEPDPEILAGIIARLRSLAQMPEARAPIAS